jgi:geranylgeranyl diphosphate synthase type II
MQDFKRYQRLLENTLVRQDFDHEPKELYEPIAYILALGGKRLRPALTLAGCDLFEGELADALMPALGIEVFHNFSLVHDDIMDKAEVRRGKKTIHQKWNTNTAILSGDAMLVKAYQYMAKVDQSLLPQILKSFSATALQICEGQQMDMNFETQTEVSEANYLEMIRLKTAVLLGCALKIGALVGKASVKQAQSLYGFGVNAGLAFQVQDDLLDAFGDPDKFGKKVGGDILQDKKTLLMIYSKSSNLPEWQALSGKDFSYSETEKVAAWQQFFISSGAKANAEAKRDALLAEAYQALEQAAGTNAAVQEQLKEFATWLAHRDR